MTQEPAGGGLPGSVVLGISVVDDQIASVVRDADGHILASNLVDLPDPSAPAVETAIVELVESVPVVVDQIGVSVSREDVRKHLAQVFASDGIRPKDSLLLCGQAVEKGRDPQLLLR